MKTIRPFFFLISNTQNVLAHLKLHALRWLSSGILISSSFPALAGVNVLTNGPSFSGPANWSLASAPTANANAGSHQDIVIQPSSAAMTNFYQAAGNTYSQSINVTNGLSYFIIANSTNYGAGSPVIRLGDGISQANSGTSFSNSISGFTNDAIYLANNSSLTISETNFNNATNPVLANPLTLSIVCTNGINFNVQTGSTLTINALITGSSSSKTLTLTGGGVFNYGGNPYAPSNILTGQLPFKALFTITNDSTCNLSGVISNGSANAVLLTTTNSFLNESLTGSIQGNTPLTINSGLASLHGTNTYTNLTTIVGPGAVLQVFGRQSLSGASSLAQGGSTAFNSTLALATADSYTMNQLQLTGVIIVTNSGTGTSTLTFTNGGFQTGTATKQISVSSNITVVIGGANFDLIGASANKNRNISLTPDTGGVITFNAVLRDNGAFQGGVEKHGHGIVNLNAVNTYTGGTTNTGGGTLLVNGSIGGVSVLSDATLGGTGTITAPILITTNGTLAPGSLTAIGTLTASGGVSLAGDVLIKVNKSVSPSNDLTVVTGTLANSGTGNITVTTNLPGATVLALGDTFKIFNQPVVNGSAMTVSGALPAGLAWQNNLEVDGSISVVNGTVTPPTLGVSQSGNVLTFTWTGAFKLQSQTNSLSTGLNNSWFDFPGGNVSGVTATINPANPTVFFRLSQ
jgi:fibronectin-binding autotransporter adhesin